MTESRQPAGYDEAMLDRLFGTVEEIEAENAKRYMVYPEFRPEQTDQRSNVTQNAHPVRARTAAAIIRRVSRLSERHQSD